jgi:hypothetical protein
VVVQLVDPLTRARLLPDLRVAGLGVKEIHDTTRSVGPVFPGLRLLTSDLGPLAPAWTFLAWTQKKSPLFLAPQKAKKVAGAGQRNPTLNSGQAVSAEPLKNGRQAD